MPFDDFQALSSLLTPYMDWPKNKKVTSDGPMLRRLRNDPFPARRWIRLQTPPDSWRYHSALYRCTWHTDRCKNQMTRSLLEVFPQRHKSSNHRQQMCCIDGMLIWIERPSKKDCEKMKKGGARFYCSRKD